MKRIWVRNSGLMCDFFSIAPLLYRLKCGVNLAEIQEIKFCVRGLLNYVNSLRYGRQNTG
jgi:hypothetical protein